MGSSGSLNLRFMRLISIVILFFISVQELWISRLWAEERKETPGVKLDVGEILFKKGLGAYQLSQIDKAISFFEQAIDKLAGEADFKDMLLKSYLYLGRCYVIHNDQVKARDAFRQALMLDPALTLSKRTDPPKIVTQFDKIKSEFESEQAIKERLAALEQSMAKEEEKKEKKKPWHKKWWIWGAGAVIVGAVAYTTSQTDDGDDKGTIIVNWESPY